MADFDEQQARGELDRDPAARDRAIRYSRTREMLVLVGVVWSGLTSVLFVVTGFSAWLRNRTSTILPGRLGPVMPYALLSSLITFVSSFPLSYYGGYTVEHRYNLSNQTRIAWLLEQLKQLGVGLLLELPLVQTVYWVIKRYPQRWWAILSGLAVPFTVLLANLAPILIMPLFNTVEPIRDRDLARRLEQLAEEQGVHVASVMQMDMSKQTKKANAMFTGSGKTKRIVLGDTLLNEFTPDEVEVVLAHELGHQVHRDIWKLIALSAPLTFLVSYGVHRFAPPLLQRYGKNWGLDAQRGIEDVAASPVLTLLAGGLYFTLTPAVNALVRGLVEHPADRYALDLTRNRQAFVSAMEKLARMNLADPKPPAVVKWLMYDHPPIQERIDFGRRYPQEHEQ